MSANTPFQGVVKADESHCGPRRVRGKIVPKTSKAALQAVILGKVGPEAALHTDGWRGYDGLVDLGFDKHFQVSHSDNEFAGGPHHVNRIESFWSFAKRRLLKFNGYLHNHPLYACCFLRPFV